MSVNFQISGGGGSKPGGSSGDIQYNNAGVLGGVTKVPLANGGTNADLSATGSATAVLAQDASHIVSARALVAADIPSLDASKITSGVLAGAQGGTPLIPSPGYMLLPWKRYNSTSNYTTSALAANGVWGVLVNIDEMITVNSAHACIAVNTAGATGNFYIGIYDTSGNRLVQLKFAIANNTTGVVAATITTAGYILVPGTYIYVFGSEVSSANLTISGMEIANTALSLRGMLNTASTRVGFKTTQISGGNLPGSGLNMAAFTPDTTSFSSVVACVVNA